MLGLDLHGVGGIGVGCAARLDDRVGGVQARGQAEEDGVELEAGDAAEVRGVAVDVVGGDDREDRLERRVLADT